MNENNENGNGRVYYANDPVNPYIEPSPLDPGTLYRRDLRRTLMKIILVLGGYLGIQMIVAGIIGVLFMVLSGAFGDIIQSSMESAMNGGPIDYDSLLDASQQTAQTSIQASIGVTTIIAAIAGLPLFLVLRGKQLFTSDITEKRADITPGIFLKLYVIAMGAQLIFNILTYAINLLLEPSGRSVTSVMEDSFALLHTPSGLLYICLIGPVVEEIIFRGAIQKSLERFGMNFSILLSSIIFGLFHIFTVQAAFAFLMGLILGYIAGRYALRWSILAHILINSVATGSEYLGGNGIPASVIFLAALVVGIFLFIRERWRITEQKEIGRPAVEGFPLYRTAFTSPLFLIYIIVTFFLGIAMIAFNFSV
jgi:membrane protease YdiL (CAAX protease family)